MPKLLSKAEADKDVLTLARERIERIFDLFDEVAVAFSGGKDSTVALNLTLEEAERRGRLPVDVIHYDEEAIPYQTEEYCRRVSQDPRVSFRWFCLPLRHRNAASRSSPWWYPWNPDERERWVRPLPPEAITELDGFVPKAFLPQELNGLLFGPERGRVALILGLRADESIMRLRGVLSRKKDNFLTAYTMGLSHCPFCTPEERARKKTCQKHAPPGKHIVTAQPIYDWRSEDVWTAPAVFGWDYNRAYDVMEMAGISARQQRIAPPFGEEPLGNLWMFKKCFPEIWPAMSTRVPGAATAARYCDTELYGYGYVDKPADMSWQEYIRHLVEKYPDGMRQQVAKTIQQNIRLHYAKTDEPILGTVPHPVTGVTWKFLARMAYRGNAKGRAAPPFLGDSEEARRKYEEARAQEEGA